MSLDCRLFVGGLQTLTEAHLHSHFGQYGELADVRIIYDKQTGASRGYGFVTFHNLEAAHAAAANPRPTVCGVAVNCNLAAEGARQRHNPFAAFGPNLNVFGFPGQQPYQLLYNQSALAQPPKPDPDAPLKVFVGGLKRVTEEGLHEYFSRFGEIKDSRIIFDRVTGLSKGYGFVTYTTVDAAHAAVSDPRPIIEGQQCNCNLKSHSRESELRLEDVEAFINRAGLDTLRKLKNTVQDRISTLANSENNREDGTI